MFFRRPSVAILDASTIPAKRAIPPPVQMSAEEKFANCGLRMPSPVQPLVTLLNHIAYLEPRRTAF